MSLLSNIIDNSGGKFFTVVFVKKDGSLRTMTARLGVTKHIAGGVCTVDRDKYIIAYDMASEGYRSINRDTIVSVSYQGETLYKGA
jgi:WYL_2, Sm-like SH3 beta-barrel fold